MGSKLTHMQLERITDYAAFERLCNSLMVRLGYHELESLGGYKDKGRDAIHYCTILGKHTIFSYSVRVDWEAKILEDAQKIQTHGHPCNQIAYVTNREIGNSDKDRIKALIYEKFGFRLRISDLEMTATLVDEKQETKVLYPEIFFLPTKQEITFRPVNVIGHLERMRQLYGEWESRYTMLFANRYDFQLQFAETQLGISLPAVPATQVAETSTLRGKAVSVLLGESGAGKSTTFWKLVAKYASEYVNEDSLVPVYVPLRNWNGSIENLVFNAVGEHLGSPGALEGLIARGKALLLFDGLNELPPTQDQRLLAQSQIRAFTAAYPFARCVFTCRTADFAEFDIDDGHGDLPRVFHTSRLLPVQVHDYALKQLGTETAARFVAALADASSWERDATRSIEKLASIPFFLRLLVQEFQQTDALPEQPGALIQRCFFSANPKMLGLREPSIDAYRRERLLSRLALDGLSADYYFAQPARIARTSIEHSITQLREQGTIGQQVAADHVWKDLISENYLCYAQSAQRGSVSLDTGQVEWIHQLLLDYCLAVGIINSFAEGTPRTALNKGMLVSSYMLQQASLIALDLSPMPAKREIFDELRRVKLGFGEALIKCIPFHLREILLRNGLQAYLERLEIDSDGLMDAAFYTYVPGIAQELAGVLKSSTLPKRRVIAEVLSRYVIAKHQSRDPDTIQSVRSVIQFAAGWMGHQDDVIRLWAAKIRWGTDRGAAAQVLEDLAASAGEAQALARETLQEWSPEN